MNTQDVVDAYLTCALWSSYDDQGEPLDASDAELSDQARAQATSECQDFLDLAREVIDESKLDAGQVGHDLWLTRNSHGTGFWDRGLGDIGKVLSRLAKAFGSCDAYIGDDGQIYFS